MKETIELLQLAHQIGFSSDICPADILLDIMIDCALSLFFEAKQQGPWSGIKNPELEFLEGPSRPFSQGSSGLYDYVMENGKLVARKVDRIKIGKGGWIRGCSDVIYDELGMQARQRIIHPELETMDDPLLPEFFHNLAQELVKVKHLHHPPKALYAQEEDQRQHPRPKISQQTYWYRVRKRGKRHLRNAHTYHH